MLKNDGDVLPLASNMVGSIALIGTQACAADPLAIGGGSGWNGCCNIPKVNVRDGIHGLTGVALKCPDGADGFAGGNSQAVKADVVLAVVAAPKAGEGSDRPTLQLGDKDIAMIRHYAETLNKTVVVAMNAPVSE